jgi:putative membrane protein
MLRFSHLGRMTLIFSAVIAGAFSLQPHTVRADSTTSAPQAAPVETKTYVDKAAAGDLFEIESSKLAIQKTKNTQIRSFAQMMVRDHTASTTKLMAILKKEKADSPAATLDPDHQAQLDSLKSESDADFDAAYVKAQLQAHQDALTLHRSYAAGGADKSLKAFATNTAKIVQTHLDHVQTLAKKLNIPA